VVVAGGIILDVGPFQLLRRQWLEAPARDHGEVALLPALVNTHAHLDLSGLAGKVRAKGSMAEWIRSLLAVGESVDAEELMIAQAEALASMHALGTGIVGDISSSGRFVGENIQGMILTRTFVELFGLHADSLEEVLSWLPDHARQALTNGEEEVSLAAHAPYTTSAALIKEVKAWGSERAKIVTIHAAESEEEILFLNTGQGPLRDLLEERGMAPDRWQPPECGAITYLDRLGFLDGLSLCVHVVKVEEEEISLLKNSGAAVCLCPRSNLFLGHGLPPVDQLLEAEISCGLGTDSLASNDDLNLFKEMAVLMDQCGIGPDTALKMATHNGARNLGLAELYGSLEKGRKWLAIRVAAQDVESIVSAGCQGALEWLR
jgi:cytosine/adenosine deaminase-related metal-dependent hydrolase